MHPQFFKNIIYPITLSCKSTRHHESRFPRKLLLFGLLIFAIIGAISVFKFFNTSPASKAFNAKRQSSSFETEDRALEKPTPRDIPFLEEPTDRFELVSPANWNTVMCWPSVGGIIVNTHVSSVELDFLKLSRFEAVPRSENISEEDEFCRQLRRTGGKWWVSYGDFIEAVDAKMRPISAKERESLLLGWPKDGGVWVMKETNWYNFSREPGSWRLRNAHTMEERCKAMEMSGAVYFENPEDCDSVKALLDGFGDHEREPEASYYYDHPANFYGQF